MFATQCVTVAGWALKISKNKSTDIKSDNDDNVDGEGVKDDDASDMASCQGKAKRIMQGARQKGAKRVGKGRKGRHA